MNTNKEEHDLAMAEFNLKFKKVEIEYERLKKVKERYDKYIYNEKDFEDPLQVNSLEAFLKSDNVVFGNDGKDEKGNELYVREKVFVAAYNDFCRDTHYNASKWTSQLYSSPFSDFNVKVVKNQNRPYPNKPGADSFGGIFFMGVDIIPKNVEEKL